VVEPLRTSGGFTPENANALSARVALRTVTGVSSRALVWGPSEIRVPHPERMDWTATDALSLLKAAGVPPAEVVVVRARLDRNSSQGRQEVSGSSGSAAGASAEWVDRVLVEILQPGTASLVVESSAEARHDPFGTDPGPGPLLDQVVADALAGLDPAWARPALPSLDVWQLLPPVGDGGLDAEVLRMVQLRLANPGMSEDDAVLLMRRPSGVYVRQAEVITRLHSGEVVTAIDGAPATPASLDRARQGTRDARLSVQPAAGASVRQVRWP
jgi:hypothetical protein